MPQPITKAISEFASNLRHNTFSHTYTGAEPPLKSELYSFDQMERHFGLIAASHQAEAGRGPDRLLRRLAENEDILIHARRLVTEAVAARSPITPAGEWLLDNFYLIEEQIRKSRRDLPKGYSRELPRLLDGPSQGFPRVWEIALQTISHGDGGIDPGSLKNCLVAYQRVTPLQIGELWAVPIMLRLALIENLRRIGSRIIADRIDRTLAEHWADRMIAIAESDPKSLILLTADMARSNPPATSAFVAEFARSLQGQSAALSLPLTWIEQRVAESGWTTQQLVQSEFQQQAADQVSMSNSIRSLRFLAVMDWRSFVEDLSIVEQTLREDPSGAYAQMDFATRDRYRHVVEDIARSSQRTEFEVARETLRLARAQPSSARAGHVGYWLIGGGVDQLKGRGTFRHPLFLYLGSICLVTAIFTAALLRVLYVDMLRGWMLWCLGALLLLCFSQMASALVNWICTLFVVARALPRMDFSAGIPPEFRTLVVVPTMLGSVEGVDELTEALEVRFLANRDPILRFALLSDFKDAPQQVMPGDDALTERAQTAIENLNRKYAGAPFLLFHRPRLWNARERVWMGYERKRGKLADLNAALRGAPLDRFSVVAGDTSDLTSFRYVITLDTDTELPRDAACNSIATMAHPLNRPRFDDRKRRVVEGYGILQPRVAASLTGANRSRYARMWSSEPGIDPYTRAVSDVYQDVFGEGSFIGKGIYDVDAFETALKGRFPENRILSHDLIEGCYARSGLISDVQLFEHYPAIYAADVSRRRRWIRGDWQILRWLLQ